MQSDSSYSVISVKLHGKVRQVTAGFNRDCQMIGYILFYGLSIIIRWQWMLCRAMSAMLGYPDFRSYRWQWRLCCAIRHFSCSNCVAVMLLKARGWRGTSLPRGSGNVWFSNPIRVLFFQLRRGYEKAEPVPGSFHASIFPHVGSLRSPTWGFQKYNSYRVANMENETHITNTRLSNTQLVPSCEYGKRQHIL